MDRGLKYRIGLVAAVVLLAAMALVPSIKYDYVLNETELPEWWRDLQILPQNNLVLGLDLQGGMDLLVSVDTEEVIVSELRYARSTLESWFESEDVAFRRIEVKQAEKHLAIDYADGESARKGTAIINRQFPDLAVVVGKDTASPVYAFRSSAANQFQRKAVEQVREILARRMDTFGLKEPEIVIQGDDSIRLQLPGIKDPERIKKMVKRSARLEFMLVDEIGYTRESVEASEEGAPPDMALLTWRDPIRPEVTRECYFPSTSGLEAGPAPANRRLVHGSRIDSETREQVADACYLLKEAPTVDGKELKDARSAYDTSALSNDAMVTFEFNLSGARQFSELTGENIGELLAIVLEGRVKSAPVIQSKIFARGQITGDFTPQEASDLASVLKSGALPVSINVEEERTVGASLGADSGEKGKDAILWGGLVVIVFMIVYYMGAGLIADLALALNIVFIMAALSMFGATLTLPGVAGIVLTVGMAVDANVLIFERIREELRTGKTPAASVDAGYGKALWTILDANITTLIAALVLMQWGTGPIKGFAVTLTLGVISSLFTAIVVSRVVYDVLFHLKRGMGVSIGIKSPAESAGE